MTRQNDSHLYTLPDHLRRPTRDLELIKELFRDLQAHDASFHFDDRAELCLDDYVVSGAEAGDGGPLYLFSSEDGRIIYDWLDLSDGMDWGEYGCHHGYMIALLHEINADHWALGPDTVCLSLHGPDEEVTVVDITGRAGCYAVVLDHFPMRRERFHTLQRSLERPNARVLEVDGVWSHATVSQAMAAVRQHCDQEEGR